MLRLILKTAGLGAVLSVGFGVAVFFSPSLIVNSFTLPWAGRALRAFEIPVTWESGHWATAWESFWERSLTISLKSPCYASPNPSVHACFSAVDAKAILNLRRQTVRLITLSIPKGTVTYQGPSHADAAKADVQALQAIFETAQPLLLGIAASELSIQEVRLLYNQDRQTLRARLSAATDKTASLSASVEGAWIVGGKRTPLRLSAVLKAEDSSIQYRLGGFWGAPASRIEAGATGIFQKNQLQGRLHADVRHPIRGVRRAGVTECTLDWQNSAPNAHVDLDCPLNFQLHKLDPLPLSTKLTGRISWNSETALSKVALQISLGITQFEKLSRQLESTPWAIPAPFNPLQGTATVTVALDSDLSFERLKSQFTAKTDLFSESQKVQISAGGNVDWNRVKNSAALDAKIVVDDTVLSLPRLDPVNLPRLFPDPNILYSDQKAEASSQFTYRLAIETRTPRSLRFLANQYGAVIPLELELVYSSQTGTSGVVRVPGFPVEFLRRNAEVKAIEVRFPKEGAAELSAQLLFHYTDYDLTLQAFGKLDSPRYSLTSTPSLSENSAWSLLLFGRPLEELTPGQGESLTNARAAATNGAVSALSMYLLASTPIESIGYDPTKGRFLATVRLVDGMSLRVEGQKEGVSSLGIRKRLGRNWVLNTYVERQSPLEPQRSVSTLLEWSHTY